MDAFVTTDLTHALGAQGLLNLSVAGRLLLAVAIGLLVGMERELAGIRTGKRKIAGLRTITLVALLGAVSVLLDGSGVLALVLLTLLGATLLVAYVKNSDRTGQLGLTTALTVLMTFLLGAMAMRGDVAVAFLGERVTIDLTLFSVVVAITATLLLTLKAPLERVVASVTPVEFLGSLEFLVVAFLILPFLPTEPVGAFVRIGHPLAQVILDAINLYELWYMVVLIAGIGYVGYLLGKVLGVGRGVVLSGFVGGLVSSTATMSAMAERSKAARATGAFAVATTVASVTSFFRVLLEVVVVNAQLVGAVALPLLAMVVAGGAAIAVMHRRSEPAGRSATDVAHRSPFALAPALKFTGFILVIKVLMVLATTYEVRGGIYVASLLSGLADVDAVTLNASSLARDGTITARVAAAAITLAVLSNMTVKTGIALLFGGPHFRRMVVAAFGAIMATGIVVIGLSALVA